ncbi:LAFA_0C05380g1_1 [Lachancea sp. 'fantastica']|nr:LAFA_0C05380g1_1 [Lachancea sp. 'fantastica']
MVDQMKLLKWGNPRLFSDSLCDYYPTSYDDLNAWLARDRELPLEVPIAGPTQVDLLDAVLYRKKDGELDLEHKLRAEYALFQATSGNLKAEQQNQASLKNKSEILSLIRELGSVALNEDNLEKLWRVQRDSEDGEEDAIPSPSASRNLQQKQLDEVTSYLLSSALQRDINLKPPREVAPHDDVAFVKQCIDALMNVVNKQPTDLPEGKAPQTNDDTTTALKDLQLAHSFLTKKFENDRNEYLHSIEKLNRTHKELVQENTTHISKISDLEDKCKSLEHQKDILTRHVEGLTTSITPTTILASPLSSPGSATGNGNSYSIGAMRAEFKKILTETRLKHEEELDRELSLRRTLEKELGR